MNISRETASPFKGHTHTPEARAKMRANRKIKTPWNKGLRGVIKISEETRRRMSIARHGKMPFVMTPEIIAKMSASRRGQPSGNKGKHISEETRAYLSRIRTGLLAGDKNPNWRGGITPKNRLIRTSIQYQKWRLAVMERDDYRCFDCGNRGATLEVDHIYPFSVYPRLRFMPENGITRCRRCHRDAHRSGIRSFSTIRSQAKVITQAAVQ